MRIRTPLLAAAVMAALAAPMAGAQTSQKSGDGYVYAPTTLGSRNPVPFVGEPVASVAAGSEANAQLTPIVEAMNADASLKGSKLTLVPDPDTQVLTVTGATVTRDQMKRALEIATAGAGEGKVANAIRPEELVIAQNPVLEGAVTASNATPAEGTTTAQAPEGEINPNAAQSAQPAQSAQQGQPAAPAATSASTSI